MSEERIKELMGVGFSKVHAERQVAMEQEVAAYEPDPEATDYECHWPKQVKIIEQSPICGYLGMTAREIRDALQYEQKCYSQSRRALEAVAGKRLPALENPDVMDELNRIRRRVLNSEYTHFPDYSLTEEQSQALGSSDYFKFLSSEYGISLGEFAAMLREVPEDCSPARFINFITQRGYSWMPKEASVSPDSWKDVMYHRSIALNDSPECC